MSLPVCFKHFASAMRAARLAYTVHDSTYVCHEELDGSWAGFIKHVICAELDSGSSLLVYTQTTDGERVQGAFEVFGNGKLLVDCIIEEPNMNWEWSMRDVVDRYLRPRVEPPVYEQEPRLDFLV